MNYERITKNKIDLDKLSEKAKSRINDTYLEYAKLNNALFELENDLESGKMIRLPCKVGDIVYVINGNDEIEKTVLDNYEANKLGYTLTVISKNTKEEYYLFDFDFKKDWFLTEAEVEKRLKELL